MLPFAGAGVGRLELTKFLSPDLRVDHTVARLHGRGGELIGDIVNYADKYRLCCMRGPAGIIVALAEELL